MYRRQISPLTQVLLAFFAGCIFTTFFNVTPKATAPIKPKITNTK